MDDKRLPYPDDDDDVISPDVVPQDQQPARPARVVRGEEEKYADTSLDANRDDQRDEHHADVEDIV